MAILLIVIVILCVYLIFRLKQKGSKFRLPPGPKGLPLLGNLFQIGSKPHLKFSQWASKFGKYYTIHLGGKPLLVVNDAKSMKKLFSILAATGRLKIDVSHLVTKGPYGIGNSDGKAWLEQKQFCMQALRHFGFGRGPSMEPLILGEVDHLFEWMDSEIIGNGGTICLNGILKQSGANVLCKMITGERASSNESKLVHLLDEWIKSLQTVINSGLAFFPWLKYIAPEKSGYQGFKRFNEKIHELVEQYFEEHKKSRKANEPLRDLIDAYIEKTENCKEPNSTFFGENGWRHSFASIVALVVAGGEPIGTMINWLIFHLTVHPKVQERLRNEIEEVIGGNREPNFADKAKMPYMEAVIFETIRFASIGPFGVPHELLENINFQGYRLPKGMILVPNLWHVHNNKEIWGDPETFRPERFLGDGQYLKKFIVSFQPGKRSCPGENVSKHAMFLFVAKLVQNYNFAPDFGSVKNEKEYLEPACDFTLVPKKLGILVRKLN